MKVKKLLLIVCLFCFIPLVNAKESLVEVKNIKLIDSSSDVVVNDHDNIDIVFNDLKQFAEYEVLLKNKTDKNLYVNDITINKVSQKFIVSVLDDNYLDKKIEPDKTTSVKFRVKTEAIDKAGKNLDDNVKVSLVLSERISNPQTGNTIYELLLSLVLLGIMILVFTKFNKKTKMYVCFIMIIGLATTSVIAEDSIKVNIDGSIEYMSQVLMENTGTRVVEQKVDYSNSKDIWAYYAQVKNIYIKSVKETPEVYDKKFDISISDKKKVNAYLVLNSDPNVIYDLYIIGNGVIYANEDSTGLFSFPNVESINGLDNVIFDNTKIYKGMFMGDSSLNSLDVSSINFENATDISYMFYKADKVDVDLDNLDINESVSKESVKALYISDILKKDAVADNNSEAISGKFILSSTLSDNYPIYYSRGENNSFVKLGNYCWQLVRTTDTGGVKMVFVGDYENGRCRSSHIGLSDFGLHSDDASNVGYMYGESYDTYHIQLDSQDDVIVYGNDIEWDGETYTLKNTIRSSSWQEDYVDISSKYHYTCFNSSDKCAEVSYITFIGDFDESSLYDLNDVHYLIFSNGDNLDSAKKKMFDNKNSSVVKTKIDDWYENNLLSYSSYIEDTVYCSDRNVISGALSSVNGSALEYSYFGAYERVNGSKNISLKCSKNDSFTVSDKNGNGALTYPIGLLSVDEAIMSGIYSYYYYYNSLNYEFVDTWLMTPHLYNRNENNYLISGGALGSYNSKYKHYIRPVISLKEYTYYISGEGTFSNPYEVSADGLIYNN